MKPARPRPRVIIEVTKSVVIPTLLLSGEGVPIVYLWDWDAISQGEEPPDIPEWVYEEYYLRNGKQLIHENY